MTNVLAPFVAMLALAFAGVQSSELQPRLTYDPAKALEYAKKYCDAGTNDCTSKQYDRDGNYDCTHFMTHALLAGGVEVKGREAACDKKLMIRVKEFKPRLDRLVELYSNVTIVDNYKMTREGDFVILHKDDARLEPFHAMLLAETCKGSGARVYAHSNDVCGDDFREFLPQRCTFYRIEGTVGP